MCSAAKVTFSSEMAVYGSQSSACRSNHCLFACMPNVYQTCAHTPTKRGSSHYRVWPVLLYHTIGIDSGEIEPLSYVVRYHSGVGVDDSYMEPAFHKWSACVFSSHYNHSMQTYGYTADGIVSDFCKSLPMFARMQCIQSEQSRLVVVMHHTVHHCTLGSCRSILLLFSFICTIIIH